MIPPLPDAPGFREIWTVDANLRRFLLVAALLVAQPTEIAAFVRPAPTDPGTVSTVLMADHGVIGTALLAGAAPTLAPCAQGNGGLPGRLSPASRHMAAGSTARLDVSASVLRVIQQVGILARLDFAGRDTLLRAGLPGRGSLAPPSRIAA